MNMLTEETHPSPLETDCQYAF